MTTDALATEPETILVWRAQPAGGGPWCYADDLRDLAAMIADGASDGCVYELECIEMTKEAWSAVPDDFPGW